jgi:hypothetical protein
VTRHPGVPWPERLLKTSRSDFRNTPAPVFGWPGSKYAAGSFWPVCVQQSMSRPGSALVNTVAQPGKGCLPVQ